MKIAMVNTFLHGGAAAACQRIADVIRQSGTEVNLLSKAASDLPYNHQPGKLNQWRARASFLAERLSFLPHEKSKAIRYQFSLANYGIPIHQHPIILEADIINLHWINQGFLSLKSIEQLQQLQKPIIWTMHDMWPFTGGCHYAGDCLNYKKECGNCVNYVKNAGPRDLSYRIHQRKQKTFSKLDNFYGLAPSKWLQDCAQQSSLFQGKTVFRIPYPILIDVFKPIPQQAARQFHQLPKDKKLAIFVAMSVDDQRKGFQYLLDSLELLHQSNPNIKEELEVVVLGNVKDQSLFDKLPFKFHFLGYLKDTTAISNAYAASDFFIIPSLEDNLPNTVLESSACGTPVIGFEAGGIPDMIDDLQTGRLVPKADAKALAEAITWMVQLDTTAYQQMRGQARKKMLDEFAPSIIAKQYNELFEQLLS